MSVEFIDTNILIYAHDRSDLSKHEIASQLIRRLTLSGQGALSIQVLAEFYSAATRKLNFPSLDAEEIISDFGFWGVHRPTVNNLVQACQRQREFGLSWWDAQILVSAESSSALILWTEDFQHDRTYGSVRVRNPFLP